MNKVILLVDDDDAFRGSVKDILELEGYKIIEAVDGQVALPLIENHSIDLVITDLLMPGIDGVELISKIKEKKTALKVIGMTGGGKIGTAEKLESSFSGFFFEKILVKPFEDTELLSEIKKAFAK